MNSEIIITITLVPLNEFAKPVLDSMKVQTSTNSYLR